ncbi:MAG: hypothetical protein R3219_07490 [Hydrogenovibrio sp.]|nr:hypothetical protein [Hydrogenovibrio sp.]
MHSIGMDDVGSALIITFGLLFASIVVVGLAMWWLYRVFKNKDTDTAGQDDPNHDV